MKLTMENKKKQWIYVGVFVVCAGASVWLWLGHQSASGPVSTAAVLNALNSTTQSPNTSKSVLPYGTGFKLDFVSSDKYRALIPATILQVLPGELGRANPFLDPGADIATSTLQIDLLEVQPYHNGKPAFQEYYPKGWKVDTSHSGDSIVAFRPAGTDTDGGLSFSANITVLAQSAEGQTLDATVATNRDVIPKVYQNAKVLAERDVRTTSGRLAHIIELSFTQGDYKLHAEFLLLIQNNQLYTVTATSFNSVWDSDQPAFDASLLSFQPF